MQQNETKDITVLLRAWQQGDEAAHDELGRVVYEQLRAIARRRLAGERNEHALQPTALVNEAYLRLMDGRDSPWRDRVHFYATAALHMRAILIDHARARLAVKRGGGQAALVTLDESFIGGSGVHETDFLLLDKSLRDLEREDARSAKIVELSYFSGLEREGIAELLGISVPTVDRCLRFGRAWLRRSLNVDNGDDPTT
ncbi:hypothetical protein B1808_00230 [Pseudofulvimonas gallinarii]|uniref:RNA polymerase ECF family sigma subunit n=2 Tax=Pseudofulvimonas gallinarii TaxID=634155 RepID=A0A4R3LIV1_9GAMM|nr:sigma-70 family RNA polymerase sigma factor [Pseudofulvimonas gallinarii]TCS99690.1 RNA polymerase ECF family sigma subunit [Pseudofulvimonas gallinarii]THD15273.1 hypothetical protein B1808_00230 [Pseudofulvimonas gallinarii]